MRRRQPWVLGKSAASLDGRATAADGTSQWITGPAARAHARTVRAEVDAIVVVTGTMLADDPALTARRPGGTLLDHQPLRMVIGRRSVPWRTAIRRGPGRFATHDLTVVLDELWHTGARRVLLDGGPRSWPRRCAPGWSMSSTPTSPPSSWAPACRRSRTWASPASGMHPDDISAYLEWVTATPTPPFDWEQLPVGPDDSGSTGDAAGAALPSSSPGTSCIRYGDA